MINLTEKAKNKINELLTLEENKNNKFLRIAVKSGGCSGLSYDLSFDNKIKRSEEHTSELQSRRNLVCRLRLEQQQTLRGTKGKRKGARLWYVGGQQF